MASPSTTLAPAPTAAADLSADIDNMVRDYVTTLAAKDEDILRIYEDNQRMRDLCVDSLRAREELEVQLGSQRLLAEALRTELHEKHQLITAQDAESRVLRQGAAALRVALGSDGTAAADGLHPHLDDIVRDVRRLLRERDALADAARHLRGAVDDTLEFGERLLVEEEGRARRQLTEAAQLFFGGPLGALHAHLLAAAARMDVDAQRERAAAAQTLADLEARHQLDEQHAALLSDRASRLLTDTVEQLTTTTVTAERRELQGKEGHGRHRCALAALQATAHALAARAAQAERLWQRTAADLTDARTTLQDRTERVGRLEEALASAQSTLAQDQASLVKLRRQRDKDAGLRAALDAREVAVQALTAELEELKGKHVSLCQRLIAQRQHASTAQRDLRAQQDELRERAESLERHRSRLEERVLTLQEENKAQARRTQTLERRLAESVEASARERQGMVEVHTGALASAVESTRRACGALAVVAEAEAEARTAVAEAESAARHHVWERMRQAGERSRAQQHAQEVGELRTEIQEWVRLVDDLREELRASQQHARAEREARELLEQQQRAESAVLEKMARATPLASPALAPPATPAQSVTSMHALRTSPAAAMAEEGAAEEVASLQRRVRVLEQACRRSAAVITELREALHARPPVATVGAPAPSQPSGHRSVYESGAGLSTSRWGERVGTSVDENTQRKSPGRGARPMDPFFGTNSTLSAIIADMDRDD